ncbi:LOW QUALITY PROTEIN: uncharacterized protein LOC108052099, partial [Drosophila rhopaloa]|uniref:Uncharacterized protein n=2 Tax=Drosophila rhopaloa TaxID=1041015 RepID=A0ABM5I4F2_DRORH
FSHGWLSTWLNCPKRSDVRLRWRRNIKRCVMGECVRWPPAGQAKMNMHTRRRRVGKNGEEIGSGEGGLGLSS